MFLLTNTPVDPPSTPPFGRCQKASGTCQGRVTFLGARCRGIDARLPRCKPRSRLFCHVCSRRRSCGRLPTYKHPSPPSPPRPSTPGTIVHQPRCTPRTRLSGLRATRLNNGPHRRIFWFPSRAWLRRSNRLQTQNHQETFLSLCRARGRLASHHSTRRRSRAGRLRIH